MSDERRFRVRAMQAKLSRSGKALLEAADMVKSNDLATQQKGARAAFAVLRELLIEVPREQRRWRAEAIRARIQP